CPIDGWGRRDQPLCQDRRALLRTLYRDDHPTCTIEGGGVLIMLPAVKCRPPTGSVMTCTATVVNYVRCPRHRVDVRHSCTSRQAWGVERKCRGRSTFLLLPQPLPC